MHFTKYFKNYSGLKRLINYNMIIFTVSAMLVHAYVCINVYRCLHIVDVSCVQGVCDVGARV